MRIGARIILAGGPDSSKDNRCVVIRCEDNTAASPGEVSRDGGCPTFDFQRGSRGLFFSRKKWCAQGDDRQKWFSGSRVTANCIESNLLLWPTLWRTKN